MCILDFSNKKDNPQRIPSLAAAVRHTAYLMRLRHCDPIQISLKPTKANCKCHENYFTSNVLLSYRAAPTTLRYNKIIITTRHYWYSKIKLNHGTISLHAFLFSFIFALYRIVQLRMRIKTVCERKKNIPLKLLARS